MKKKLLLIFVCLFLLKSAQAKNKLNETQYVSLGFFDHKTGTSFVGYAFNVKIIEAEEEIDTVGGLVFFIANKIPKKNETFNYKNKLNFKILSASDRRINTLEIQKI